ncbi:hypothetical protein [Diaphorobacter caeni]|uniref:hypothetical protein n=1 Tax=Diaphorobacter caeni TaxID=2784387 RepID=UPI0018901D40|nr:hypothetical protein [Diaphorobacter caeni]MBF5004362.1 hypothetical protein [Diaphorobacter caeni]
MRSLIKHALLLVLTLGLVLIALIVVANWRDEPLSTSTKALLSSYKTPTEEQLQDNGFLILSGLDAPLDDAGRQSPVQSAMQAGRQRLDNELERKQWFEKTRGNPAEAPAPFQPESAMKASDILPDALQCKPDLAPRCHEWYLKHADALRPMLAAQQPSLMRLAAATKAERFESYFPPYMEQLFPPYQHLVRIHELQLAQASLLWHQGQQAKALDLLEQSDRLTERLASASNHLVGNLVALQMQYRRLRWLSDVVATSRFPISAVARERVQVLLDAPIVSIRNGLNGEAVLMATFMASMTESSQDWADITTIASEKSQAWKRWLRGKLDRATYLPNETLNQQTEWWAQFLPTIDTDAHDWDAALSNANNSAQALKEARTSWLGLRNYTGNLIADVGTPNYAAYVQRRHDIEGFRRLALVQFKAKAQHISAEKMPSWLQTTPDELRDPYTLKPMQWDATSQSLIFEGREAQTQNPGRSKTYRIRY